MPDALALVGPTGAELLVFFCFSISVITCYRVLIVVSSLYSFDFYVYRRCCTDELETLHADWTIALCVYHGRRGLWPRKIGLSHPQWYFYWPFQAVILLWFTISVIICLCMYFLVKVLFILLWIAVWPTFGKKLSFWLSACSVFCLLWCRCCKCVLLSLWCLGYSLDIMRQTTCLVVNPIIVDGYASLFNCTTAVRVSDSMTASS